jgi:hypothetical protein
MEKKDKQSKYPYWSIVRIVLMVLGSTLILIALLRMIRNRNKK